jgi:cell division protein FtsB
MAGIDRRRFITKLTHSPLAYIILLLLAGLFVWNTIGAYRKSRVAESRMVSALEENARLQDQKTKLTNELENANTDFGREKALREKFNVVKAGEQVIVLVPEENGTSTPATAIKSGFWARLFGK